MLLRFYRGVGKDCHQAKGTAVVSALGEPERYIETRANKSELHPGGVKRLLAAGSDLDIG